MQLGIGAQLGSIVLGIPFSLTQTINDSVTYTDTITSSITSNTFGDTLTYTDVLTTENTINLAISDTLTYTETLIHEYLVTLSDTLTYTDTFTEQNWVIGSLTDSITYSDTLTPQITAGRVLYDTMSRTDSFHTNIVKNLALSDTFSYTDTIVGTDPHVFADTLTYTDTFSGVKAHLMSESISATDYFTIHTTFNRASADAMVFYGNILIQIYSNQSTSDTLTYTDRFVGNNVKQLGPDTCSFVDTLSGVSAKPLVDTGLFSTSPFVETWIVNKVQNKSFNESVTYTEVFSASLIVNVGSVDTLTYLDSVAGTRVRFGVMNDTLTYSDSTYRTLIETIIDETLTFVDTMSYNGVFNYSASDALTYSDTDNVKLILNLPTSDVLVRNDGFLVRLIPLNTSTVADYLELDGTLWNGVIVQRRQVVFVGQTSSIVLPPAEFNDYESNQGKITVNRMMSGNFKVMTKRTFREKLNYKFIVPKPKADEFRAFFLAEANNKVTLINWKAEYWTVNFITDSVDFTEVRRWSPNGNAVEFTIELAGTRYV